MHVRAKLGTQVLNFDDLKNAKQIYKKICHDKRDRRININVYI